MQTKPAKLIEAAEYWAGEAMNFLDLQKKTNDDAWGEDFCFCMKEMGDNISALKKEGYLT